jgi:DNA-binding response OmpR family regulator
MVAPAKPNPFQDPSGSSSTDRLLAAREASILNGPLTRLAPPLRLLVVDPDPGTAKLLCEALGAVEAKLTARRSTRTKAADGPTVYAVGTIADAIKALKKLASRSEPIDLVIAELDGPDGTGLALAESLAATRSETRLIVTSRQPSLAGSLSSFRLGALDYLPKPLDAQGLGQRIRLAAARRYLQMKDQRRLGRLKSAVRQLNQARRTVGRKVDLLCQDLVSAYTELSRQVERVRVGQHLRRQLESAADLEQLLCHMMDWILRELGHCNIAIFLTDDEGRSELGAYMKHTISGEAAVTRWLAKNVIPRVGIDGFLHAGDDAAAALGKGELKAMAGHAFLAVDCAYLAESLGTLIIFRRSSKPFASDNLDLLKAAGAVFATALTNLVHGGGKDSSPDRKHEQADDDEQEWWRRSA